jgi:hypothetical protein
MSPLLGSSGGSSEYAFRGTLDDWPVDFAAALAAQNPPALIDPGIPITATLTITGLNYKARVIVNHPNATVRVISELGGIPVTDGREVYAAREESDPPLFIRDQSVISIRLQPTSGTLGDFNKDYVVSVKIGKRNGTWQAKTRDIDQTPTSFSFSPLIDQELGITTTSTITPPVTIAGLENGFSFPISVTANQVGGNVKYFKNGVEFTTSSTVVNGDQIYLSTLTPSTYTTTRTFTVQVGNFTTSWGILTRDAVTTITPFSFTGISSANQSGFGYTSGFMTISGADPGIGLPVSMTGGSFQILLSDGITPRYPAPPAPPPYWQTSPSTAFNGDRINVRVFSATIPPNYSTTTSGTLTVSDQSATFNVTTRPEPIDTIPQNLNNAFTDLTGPTTSQDRGIIVQSNAITLSSMSPAGATGTASISAPAAITPQFNVNGSATWISPPTTAAVKNGDTIRLRMTTPIQDNAEGVATNTILFRVDGVDTTTNTSTPIENPQGYTTFTGLAEDFWNVTTKARTCDVTPFTFSPNLVLDSQRNFDNTIDFTVGGYNSDCKMRVQVTSPTSSNYGFTRQNGVNIVGGPVTVLNNVAPGTVITLSVRASDLYVTDVTAVVTVTNVNVPVTITPERSYSTSWTIRTVADTTPATISLNPDATTLANGVEIGSTFTLNWTTVNCTSLRSAGINWTPPPSLTLLNGSSSPITAPNITDDLTYPISQPFTYTISAYVNPSANNAGPLPSDAGGKYITASTTVNVNQDTTPSFTPNQFNSQPDVEPSNLTVGGTNTLISNSVVVDNITVPLYASINTSLSSSSAFIFPNSLTKDINAGTSIQLQVNAALANGPVGYNVTTSAAVDFKDSAGNIKATRIFSVTTRSCQTSVTLGVRYPPGAVINYVDLDYYQNATYSRLTGTPTGIVADNLLISPTFSSSNGNLRTLADGSILGWSDAIAFLWNSFTLNAQRPPTNVEVNTALNSIVSSPLTAASVANILGVQSFFDTFATGQPLRNINIPILDSPCENVINGVGGY